MKIVTILFFVVTFIAKSNGRTTRIIGGKLSKPGDVPSVVAIVTLSMTQFCGGTLITQKHVLSAAHCMVYHKNPKKVLVVGSKIVLPKRRTKGTFEVKKIINHPGFNRKSFRNDFAILELLPKLKMSRLLKVAHMVAKRPPAGTTCEIAGWGYADEDADEPSTKLLIAQIGIRPDSDCSKPPVNSNPKYDICAGVKSGAKDACYGDSGGPLLCKGKLAGVISFGIGCGRKGLFGVYADVIVAKKWILSIVSNKGERSLRPKRRASKVSCLYGRGPVLQTMIFLKVVKMSL
ncbi:trypsin alpha-3-like [Hermetia illucens]|uniref:trypsin alpha-3-like n=1 Tax=Hermetia illucens TaxID=343691 RepID=UPI0018CC263F|nr:trypsin alpha-3-like [Hermetia illucens]